MEFVDGTTDVVHPEVRAHINSLVSAVSNPIYSQGGPAGSANIGTHSLVVTVPKMMVNIF